MTEPELKPHKPITETRYCYCLQCYQAWLEWKKKNDK